MIYFMQPVDGGPIKIGYSANPEERRIALQSLYGRKLAILATMPGNRSTEAEIHARFSHLRFARTEQFRPASDLLEFIGRPLLVSPNPDAVEPMDGKRHGVLIRVSDEFAAAIRDASQFEKASIAEYLDRHYLASVQKRYRDAVVKAARKFESNDKG